MNDKTKLRTDKERLSGREFIYHKLFNNTLDAVILASPEGDILDANENACKMFGLTLAEIITGGRSRLMDLSDPRLQLALDERQRTGKFFGELTGIRKDGSKFPVEVASMIFKTDNGGEFTS